MLTYLLDQLADAGITRAALATGYLGEQIETALGTRYGTLTLAYSRETEPLGTAGAVCLARPLLGSGPVLVLNGDSYVHANLRAFLAAHRARRAQASILLTRVSDPARFGSVTLDEAHRIIAFQEKGAATSSQPDGALINAGVYLLSPQVVSGLPAEGVVSLEREVFPALIGHGLHGFAGGGRFIDIGVPESFDSAAAFFAISPAPSTDRPAVALLDRDGTLMTNHPYLGDPAGVELLPGVLDGLARLRALGLRLVVLTNQSGIGRGLVTEAQVAAVHARLTGILRSQGVTLDGIFHCPHAPEDGCDCRKPRDGMVRQAQARLGVDPLQAVLVGDNRCDIELAHAVGATAILVTSGYGAELLAREEVDPDLVADSLADVARILAHPQGLTGVTAGQPLTGGRPR
jgi:histidinol-phosphate phosphatase family protein